MYDELRVSLEQRRAERDRSCLPLVVWCLTFREQDGDPPLDGLLELADVQHVTEEFRELSPPVIIVQEDLEGFVRDCVKPAGFAVFPSFAYCFQLVVLEGLPRFVFAGLREVLEDGCESAVNLCSRSSREDPFEVLDECLSPRLIILKS